MKSVVVNFHFGDVLLVERLWNYDFCLPGRGDMQMILEINETEAMCLCAICIFIKVLPVDDDDDDDDGRTLNSNPQVLHNRF